MRGQAGDYDHWRQLGLTGWGWDDVQPIFRAAGPAFPGRQRASQRARRTCVDAPRVRWEILDAIVDAAAEMGIPKTADFNTGDNEGSCYFHVNQKRGRRWSAARGFLKPALHRPNLRLETGVAVDRVLFDGKRATGVRFRRGNEMVRGAGQGRSDAVVRRHRFGADPAAFRRRPGAWLNEVGIPVLHALEGVGRNLQDHLQLRVMYRVSGVKTLNQIYYSPLGRPLMGLQYALLRRGPMTMAASQFCVFTRSDPSQERANIQFHVQPLSLDRFGTPLHRFPSHHRQPLQSAPHVARHGADDIGRAGCRAGDQAQLSFHRRRPPHRRRLPAPHPASDAPAGAGALCPEEFRPGPDVSDSDADLIHAAGDIGTTIFHPVGTAKMGLASDPLRGGG